MFDRAQSGKVAAWRKCETVRARRVMKDFARDVVGEGQRFAIAEGLDRILWTSIDEPEKIGAPKAPEKNQTISLLRWREEQCGRLLNQRAGGKYPTSGGLAIIGSGCTSIMMSARRGRPASAKYHALLRIVSDRGVDASGNQSAGSVCRGNNESRGKIRAGDLSINFVALNRR